MLIPGRWQTRHGVVEAEWNQGRLLAQVGRLLPHERSLECLLLRLGLLLRNKSLLRRGDGLRRGDRRTRIGEHADGPSPGVVEGGLGPSCALVNAGALAPVVAITCRTLAGGALVAVAALALAA